MNAQIREEAAEWLVELRLEDVDAAMRERFTAWLRTSPEHVGAYLELLAFWDEAAAYDTNRRVDVEELIALARSESNVVALESVASSDVASVRPPARRRFKIAALAAGVVVAVAIASWLVFPGGTTYGTGVGQQLSIGLADGSSIELNARSRVRVRYSAHDRRVDLLTGQALFRVAKDAARPFVVVSGDTRVRAVGTQFDVLRKRSATVVTVLEGRVALLQPASTTLLAPEPLREAPSAVEIGAGEQLVVTPSAAPQASRGNIETAMAWRQQQLVFESAPLPDVADEFNRFNTRQLLVDARLADFRVSGNFPALDPTSLPRFVRFLREQPGIGIDESEQRIVITQK